MDRSATHSQDGRELRMAAPDFTAQIVDLCTQLAALDQEIATIEQQEAQLPTLLTVLARHPVLWLVLGREGVDRPGQWGALLGQQVVTVVRRDWATLVIVAIVLLLLGGGIGVGSALLWNGLL